MITIRAASERGHANHGWLDSFHTFSFANYFDHEHMGFRALRVINEDRVAPGRGFGEHPHDNMEIISYVLEGAIAHRDSLGSGESLRPGEVQHMSAGTGIRHSEFNPSVTDTLHFLQIWLLPNVRNPRPSYAQKPFPIQSEPNTLHLVASTDGRDGSIAISADAELYAATLTSGASTRHALSKWRNGWLQVVRGTLTANGHTLSAGDGAALESEELLELSSDDGAEFLFFELA